MVRVKVAFKKENAMKQEGQLNSLCRLLLFAKSREEQARKERVALEEQISNLLPAPAGTEGTTTNAIDGFKVVVTRRLNRKLDHEAYMALGIPTADSFVDYQPKIDLKQLRRVEAHSPEWVSACVTVSPAKASVKVEEIK